MATQFRSLSSEEISLLTKQGCTCEDFSKVKVAEGFNADRLCCVHFSGEVTLGVFDNKVTFPGGLSKESGIYNATIHNCDIGDNVYISQIRNYIANYRIEDGVVIDNVDMLAVEGQSSFGNGVELSVVNEAGGREIPIFDHLSAHTAYIIAFYRHRTKVIEKLCKMIEEYTASVSSDKGVVRSGSRLVNCKCIKDVKIGPDSRIEGIETLKNGSINSSVEDPVYIGPGVIAKDFIVSSGSCITDGAIISKCFIGQGCELAKQYSAEESVFFANCGGYHGEACAIFAGPYTVTHHKSTLLIAGLFSFLNAGSGTNQSNHMYKLGPVHQGVVERGSKTASDSYMLWPARVGAFTVVMGRHYRNSDTTNLPFSYLIEHEDESILVPGVNLRSVGTVRDARKWPKRDKRKDSNKLDCINFKLLSPYTVQKMIKGSEILSELKASSGETSDYYTYHRVRINHHSLFSGIEMYEMGVVKFLGNCLLKRLENEKFKSIDEVRNRLKPQSKIGKGKWVDIAGLLAPCEAVEEILVKIEEGKISNLDMLTEEIKSLHGKYPEYEWAWAVNTIEKAISKTIDEITKNDIVELTNKWKDAVVKLDDILHWDTQKEFSSTAQTGYGIDGEEVTKEGDFAEVHGRFEESSFVKEIEQHVNDKTSLAEDLISRIKNL